MSLLNNSRDSTSALFLTPQNLDNVYGNITSQLKQSHHYCEDNWYSCPLHPNGCANADEPYECNCGADKHNAKIDEIITELSNNCFNLTPGF